MILTSRRMVNLRLRSLASRTAALSGLLAALLAMPALADDASELTKLMRGGQYAQALSKADSLLRKNPRDPQLRFLKGVILTEQSKSAEAIAIFTKLTEDYPNLPEPYNNLAVLYASEGQYDKARNALDAAIRTNPSYATAYENLGDVHARLASQAYDKALQLDSANPTAKSKLTLVHSLVGNMNGVTVAQAPTTTPAPQPKPAPSQPAAAPQPKPAVPAKPEPPKPEPAKPEPIKPEVKKPAPETKPAQNVPEERDEVMKAVNAWADAWSARDVKAYLGSYSKDFDLPANQSRKDWEEQRRARIVDKTSIDVKIGDPQVTVKGSTATVKFRQSYVSNSFSANTAKTLVLKKRNGNWLIQQELTGK